MGKKKSNKTLLELSIITLVSFSLVFAYWLSFRHLKPPTVGFTPKAWEEGIPYSPKVLADIEKMSGHHAFCVMHFIDPKEFSVESFWYHYRKYAQATIDFNHKYNLKLKMETPSEIDENSKDFQEFCKTFDKRTGK